MTDVSVFPNIRARAPVQSPLRTVILQGIILHLSVGVHPHEKTGLQRVRLNARIDVSTLRPHGDDHAHVFCYEQYLGRLRSIAAEGHVHLVETLAEAFALEAFEHPQVQHAWIKLEKLDVEAEGTVGVEVAFSRD